MLDVDLVRDYLSKELLYTRSFIALTRIDSRPGLYLEIL